MSQAIAVLATAEALRREAHRLDEGAGAEAEAKRISGKTDQISAELGELDKAVVVARYLLHTSGSAVSIDFEAAAAGLTNFGRHVKAGLPSDAAFTAAKNKIIGATSELRTSLGEQWADLTARRMSALPVGRIVLLPQSEQQEQRGRLEAVRTLAKKSPPEIADVRQFELAYGLLKETLDELPDPAPEISVLLQKLEQRPRPTLADLTDDDIHLFRQAGIANQIELRRREI